MNRLKFLVFALIALGLWAYHLLQVSPAVNEPGQAAARSAVVGAPAGVALALESQRSELQAAVLKLAASPAVLNMGPKPGAKVEAPGVDRFAAVRPVVADALSEANKAKVVIGLVNEAGALVGQGAAEPAAPPEGFDVQALAAPGASPAIAAFNGAPTLFYATPLLISDKNEVRAAGAVLVGLPLLPDAKVLEALVKSEGLKGLALLQDGKVLVAAGDQASAAGAVQKVKAGTVGAVNSGSVRALGPLDLPLLVGSVALDVAARQPVAGTPFEVIATATARPSVEALASYQVFAVSGLAGLFLLAIVFALLIQGGGEEEGARLVVPPPMPVPPLATKREEPPQPAPLAVPDHAPAPEASPDDFDFPMSGPSAIATGQAPAYQPPPAAEPGPEPEADPFAAMAPPPPPPAASYPPARPPSQPPAPVAPPPPPVAKPAPPVSPFEEEDEGARTVAYPAFKPPPAAAPPPVSDPFALAASQLPDDGAGSYEDTSDATRVAAVPQELIKQARSGAAGGTSERPSLRPPTTSLPRVQSVAPVGGASEEDRHFQDVFRDFVATRQKCGEPADGLTFEKFKAKLLKNKEQLVAKYQCRTVRFQVYVKDGKAALKATPVKD